MFENMVCYGDSELLIKNEIKDNFIHLIFTSPPYFNARPEYSVYDSYEEYKNKMRYIIKECNRVLREGRFFIINSSPVIVPRKNRSCSSERIPIPFDLHNIIMEENFDFVEDIVWVKPDGASKGRGRTFFKTRLPLSYKTEPVTEYIFVYRKKTKKLIDWNIKNDVDIVNKNKSLIKDGYERTNVWKINPSRDKLHPAVFPLDLACKVVSYYSFVGDIVMDPFAGVGTTGEACIFLDRKYILIEKEKKYIKEIIKRMNKNIFLDDNIKYINC